MPRGGTLLYARCNVCERMCQIDDSGEPISVFLFSRQHIKLLCRGYKITLVFSLKHSASLPTLRQFLNYVVVSHPDPFRCSLARLSETSVCEKSSFRKYPRTAQEIVVERYVTSPLDILAETYT